MWLSQDLEISSPCFFSRASSVRKWPEPGRLESRLNSEPTRLLFCPVRSCFCFPLPEDEGPKIPKNHPKVIQMSLLIMAFPILKNVASKWGRRSLNGAASSWDDLQAGVGELADLVSHVSHGLSDQVALKPSG